MANYYVPLAQQTPGQGINLEPVNAALDSIMQQNNQNRAYAFQQKQFDANQQQRQFENARATKQDAAQQVKMFGDQATAVDQMTDPNQRAAAWKSILARHGTNGLSPEELDPVSGPKLMAAQAGQFLDPRDIQAKDLALQETRAKINKLNVEAQNGGEAYGKTGAIFLNPETGRYEAVQFGGRGQVKRTELGGLTPSKGVETVGDQLIDKATGQPVRNVGANIAEGERQKVVGRETGEGQMNLPKNAMAVQQSKVQNDVVIENIDKALNAADGYTTGFSGAITSNIPGTKAYDLSQTLATVKANLGFDKLQAMRDASPTGGALGQVSEMENRLLQSVWGSVEQSQSPTQLKKNLQDIKNLRQRFQRMKEQAYETDVKRFGKANVPSLDTGKLPNAPQAPPEAAASRDPSNAPVRVNTPDEALSLPSGTVFMTPDGRTKVRP
jgi:hypothetical protein